MTRQVPGFSHACLGVLCFLVAYCMSSPAIADDIKFEGEVSTGVKVEGFKNGKAETEAELKIETKRVDSIKAHIDLEMDSKDREVELDEVYLDAKFSEENKLVFGLTKKIIGLEYERSNKQRMPLSRTLIYRKLESFAYVGKETTVRFVSEDEESKRGVLYAESWVRGIARL